MKKTYFDLETTGVDVNNDRIVQIAIKVMDGKECVFKKTFLVNPERPILKEVSEIHGIYDKHVKNAPTFKALAKTIAPYFEGHVIIGYNILKFDLPLLYNEFERIGRKVNFSDKIVDVYRIEKIASPRTLSAAYKKYTGKDLDGAHDAGNDVDATHTVFRHQKTFIKSTGKSVYELSESDKLVDFSGHLVKNNKGEICFAFGKHKGKRLIDEKAYCKWMLTADFSNQTKSIIKKHL